MWNQGAGGPVGTLPTRMKSRSRNRRSPPPPPPSRSKLPPRLGLRYVPMPVRKFAAAGPAKAFTISRPRGTRLADDAALKCIHKLAVLPAWKETTILGPRDQQRNAQNPDLLRPPPTDNGSVPNLRFSFADTHVKMRAGGCSREVTHREFPSRRRSPASTCGSRPLAAQNEISRIGTVWPLAFAAPGGDVDDFEPDCARQAADDLILNLKEIAASGVKTLGPNLVAELSIHEARIHANVVAVQHGTAFEDVAQAQVAPDCRASTALPL